MADLLPSSPDAGVGEDGDPRVIGVDSDDADDLLAALQSDTARNLLAALYDEPATPSALADEIDTSIQNVRYHLEKLTDAELVEVADTVYSEKGREMKVYAPVAKPLVVLAGGDDDAPGLEAALSRLLGALGALGLSSLLVQRLASGGPLTPDVGFSSGSSGDGAAGGANASATAESDDAEFTTEQDVAEDGTGGEATADVTGDEVTADATTTEEPTGGGFNAAEATTAESSEQTTAESAATTADSAETVTEATRTASDATRTATEDTPTASDATRTVTESAETRTAAETTQFAEGTTRIAEETTQAAETARSTTEQAVTTTVTEAAGAATSGLPPGLVFFAGGLVVLAALGVAWYLRAR